MVSKIMMARYIIHTAVCAGLMTAVMACNDRAADKRNAGLPDEKETKKKLEHANKMLVKNETFEIDNYIKRRRWDMAETGTGLRYMIYHEGDGPQVKDGNKVTLHYDLTLLNGARCYNSDDDGPKEFVVGKEEAESGLQEALLLMKQGDKARLIIPPHLGYGLLGDEKKIPGRATLVYDLEVAKVE